MKTKEDIRNSLTISAATVANWVKTGIIPDYRTDDRTYSDMEYDEIISKVSESGKLKTRANRFHSTDSRQELNTLQSPKSKILLKALFEIVKTNATDIATAMLALSLRTLEQAGLIEAKLSKTKNQYSISITSGNKQFSNFLKSWYSEVCREKFFSFYQSIDQFYLITDEPDFLGAFYESMRNLGEKSKLGAFFTPSFLVKDLVIPIDASVLDPCSGTGTILLSIIDKNHSPSKITLRDIDELALRLAKVNFVLFFKRTDILINTVCSDAILWSDKKKFEYIITNPPWGAFKDPDCMASIVKINPAWKTLDSFSIILSQAIDNLSKKSKLVFILPESFLYVDAYQAVREKIFEKKAGITVSFFGNAFRGVQSKVIRLEADFSKDRKFFTQNKSEVIEFSDELLRKNDFRPPAIRSKAELQILKKILKSNHFTLKGKCIFGLGIVTGNNKKHLQDTHKKGFEPIYTGKELNAFDFSAATSFIDFNPKNIQQSAPENLYRSPKICYRFISNKLQMTADFEGKLILNSVNFFIPPDGIALKALAAFLNSPLCSFLYQRLFNSVKVLKAHLEKLPIPYTFYDCEEKLTLIYDKASLGLEYRNELHQLTLEMFGLPSDVVFDI